MPVWRWSNVPEGNRGSFAVIQVDFWVDGQVGMVTSNSLDVFSSMLLFGGLNEFLPFEHQGLFLCSLFVVHPRTISTSTGWEAFQASMVIRPRALR